MRVMTIRAFPHRVDIPDFDYLVRKRLSQEMVLWWEQAFASAGYMCYPNDIEARKKLLADLEGWPQGSMAVPSKLPRIQHEWLRVADIFHTLLDLAKGEHQQRRGGPSLAKAITVVANTADSWGTGEPNLWRLWAQYKDVAHLITAAVMICADVRARANGQRFGVGLSPDQFLPFQMVMFMPDWVLAVALDFERYGLTTVSHSRNEPAFDHDTLWRIPSDINVVAVPSLQRAITTDQLVVLNARRSGNRGKANRHETTLIS